ncbi:alpha/beta hydrolase family protein [Ferrovibrio xuzhouensis]|uniref:Alpha/beta hydrolase family protein n=1 Tax=Ferrovibrio xuzhouensis TaxID=1576914 RepID=A0ABV7VA98_9PROT
MRRRFAVLVTGLLILGRIAAVQAAETTPSQQVRFAGAGGIALAGTLALPMDTTKPVPAVLLLQGSGPTDRDGNQPPALRTDLLRQIADLLAARGIASLRYDKRGMYANAASLPADQKDYAEFFRWENFVGDALAAEAFLAGQASVDARRIALLGHSEGGLIALVAAQTLQQQGRPPAALVLAATPGRRIDQLIRDQITRSLKADKTTDKQRRFFLSANDRVIKAIRMTGKVPDSVPPALQPLYPFYIGPFMQAQFAVDPAALARDFAGPVLILQGASDVQVSPEKDALALDHALLQRGRDDHAVFIVPGVSHNLKPVDTDSEPGFEGPVSDAIRDRLAEWLQARLQAGG